MALYSPGEIVTGIEDINQQIAVVITTRTGEVPGRPLFGSDVPDNVDLPINIAATKTKKDVVFALGLHIPAVTVKSVKTTLTNASNGVLAVSVVWEYANSAGNEQTIEVIV